MLPNGSLSFRERVRMNGNGVTLSPFEPSLQGLGHQFAEQRHGGGMRFSRGVCRRLTARLLALAGVLLRGAGCGMPMRVRIVRPSPPAPPPRCRSGCWLTNTTCRGSPRHRDRQWRGSASGTGCRTSPAAAARRRPAERECPVRMRNPRQRAEAQPGTLIFGLPQQRQIQRLFRQRGAADHCDPPRRLSAPADDAV